jgi:hypothetical protein
MVVKGNVPLFNESVDASKPAQAGKKFIGMAFGGAVALAALMAGRWIVQQAQNTSGVGEGADTGIPVAGD